MAILKLLDHQSRLVVLPDGIWKNKILMAHPEVEPYLETEIPKAVSLPTFVNRDKIYSNRFCHYLELPLSRKGKRRFLKVVIEYNQAVSWGNTLGTIISVYRTGGVPSQELRLWP